MLNTSLNRLPQNLFACLATLCLVLPAGAQDNNQPPEGFEAVFNGEDLAGWTGGTTRNPAEFEAMSPEDLQAFHERMAQQIRQHWSVQEGELVSDGRGPHLVSTQDFTDFELELGARVPHPFDSGIFLRMKPGEKGAR